MLQNCLVRCENGVFTAVVGDFGLAEKIPDYRSVFFFPSLKNFGPTDLRSLIGSQHIHIYLKKVFFPPVVQRIVLFQCAHCNACKAKCERTLVVIIKHNYYFIHYCEMTITLYVLHRNFLFVLPQC